MIPVDVVPVEVGGDNQKNLRFGLGLSATHIGKTDRRDRLLLLAAIAQALLTLLGAAGEACGLDRLMKTNTSKKRTMSLLNQGGECQDSCRLSHAARRRSAWPCSGLSRTVSMGVQLRV